MKCFILSCAFLSLSALIPWLELFLVILPYPKGLDSRPRGYSGHRGFLHCSDTKNTQSGNSLLSSWWQNGIYVILLSGHTSSHRPCSLTAQATGFSHLLSPTMFSNINPNFLPPTSLKHLGALLLTVENFHSFPHTSRPETQQVCPLASALCIYFSLLVYWENIILLLGSFLF